MNNKKLKLTNIFDPLLKNRKYPIIMNFTLFFNKNVWKLTLFKLNVLVHDHKIQTKKKFIEYFNEQKNIRTILTLLAIGIGGYQITQIRYKDHFYLYFLRKNLSSVCLPFPNITWETFNYLNYQYYLEQQIKRIDVYNDSLYIEMKPFWENKQKQLYIGEFLPKSFRGIELRSIDLNEASKEQLNLKNNPGLFTNDSEKNKDEQLIEDQFPQFLTQLLINNDVNTPKNKSLFTSADLKIKKHMSETKIPQPFFLPSHNVSQYLLSDNSVYQGDELPNKLENFFETIERSSCEPSLLDSRPQIELNQLSKAQFPQVIPNEFSLILSNDLVDQTSFLSTSNLPNNRAKLDSPEELKENQLNTSRCLNSDEPNQQKASNETMRELGELNGAQLEEWSFPPLAQFDTNNRENLLNTPHLPNVPIESIALSKFTDQSSEAIFPQKSSTKFPSKFIFAPIGRSLISPLESTLFLKSSKNFPIEGNSPNSVPLFASKNTISKLSIGRSAYWTSSLSLFQNKKSSISNLDLKNSNVGDRAALDRLDFRKNAYYENLENFQQTLKKTFTKYLDSDCEAISSDFEKQEYENFLGSIENEDPSLLDDEIELEPSNLTISELKATKLLNQPSPSSSINRAKLDSPESIQLNESTFPTLSKSDEDHDFTPNPTNPFNRAQLDSPSDSNVSRHHMEFLSEFNQIVDDLFMQPRKMSGYQYPDSSIVNPPKSLILEKMLFNSERENSQKSDNSYNWGDFASLDLGDFSSEQLGEKRSSVEFRSEESRFDPSVGLIFDQSASINWLKIIKKIKNNKKLEIFHQTTFPQLGLGYRAQSARLAQMPFLKKQSKIFKITSIPKNFYSPIKTINQWTKTNLEELSYTSCSQPNNSMSEAWGLELRSIDCSENNFPDCANSNSTNSQKEIPQNTMIISNDMDQKMKLSKAKLREAQFPQSKPNLQNTDFDPSFLVPKIDPINRAKLDSQSETNFPNVIPKANGLSESPDEKLNFFNSKFQTQYLRTNLNNYKEGFGGINVLSIEKVYEKFPKLIEQLKTESVYGPNLFENLEKLPFMSQKNYFRGRSLFQNHKMTLEEWVDWSKFNKTNAQLNYVNANSINEPRELRSFLDQQLMESVKGIQTKEPSSLVSMAPSDFSPSYLGESRSCGIEQSSIPHRLIGDVVSINRFNSNKTTQSNRAKLDSPQKTQILFHFFTNPQTSLNSSEMQNIGSQIIYQKWKPNHDQILSFTFGKDNNLNGRSSINNNLYASLQYRLSSIQEFVIRLNKNSHFSEIWEPLSNNWYMVLTQISFVLFVVKLMEDLYKKDYGSEIVSYIIEYIPPQFIEFLELDMVINSHKELRNIQKIEKRFKNIAGVSNLLPELGDLVWFLKNYDKNSVLIFNFVNQIFKPNKRFAQLPQTILSQWGNRASLDWSKNFSLSNFADGSLSNPRKGKSQKAMKGNAISEKRNSPNSKQMSEANSPTIYFNPESNQLLGQIDQRSIVPEAPFSKTRSYWNNRRGILLVGPPGTGKTLLVQAIAGEAGVPVLVQSASLLISQQNQTQETGDFRLKRLFDAAREQAPCIIFIDEIDSIGLKRENIMQHSNGNDNLIESIYTRKSPSNTRNLKQKRTSSAFTNDFENFFPTPIMDTGQNNSNQTSYDREELYKQSASIHSFDESSSSLENKIAQNQITTSEFRQQQLTILTQFLVEMDGLKSLKGVVVVGATNRPETLDNALIRPGRLDRVLNIKLPGKTKRIDILKLYSQNLGVESSISWDYVASRTVGLSAAHLSAIMNRSAIQAILENTHHSTQTIEYGIDAVSSSNSQKSKFQLLKLSSLSTNQSREARFPERNEFTKADKRVFSEFNRAKLDSPSEMKVSNAQWPFKNNLIEVFKNKYAYIQVLNLNFDRILINTELKPIELIDRRSISSSEIPLIRVRNFPQGTMDVNSNCWGQSSEARFPQKRNSPNSSILVDIKNNEKQFYQKNRGRIKKILFFGKLLKTKIHQFQNQLSNCAKCNSFTIGETSSNQLREAKSLSNRCGIELRSIPQKRDYPSRVSETSFQPIQRSFIPPAQSSQMDFSLYITTNSIEQEIFTVLRNFKTNQLLGQMDQRSIDRAKLDPPAPESQFPGSNRAKLDSPSLYNETMMSQLNDNEPLYNNLSSSHSVNSIDPSDPIERSEIPSAKLDPPERRSNTISLVTNEFDLDIAYKIKRLQIKRSSFLQNKLNSFNLDKVSPIVETLSVYSSELSIDSYSLKSHFPKSEKIKILHNFVEFLNEFHFTIFDLIQNIQFNFGLFPNSVKRRLLPNMSDRNDLFLNWGNCASRNWNQLIENKDNLLSVRAHSEKRLVNFVEPNPLSKQHKQTNEPIHPMIEANSPRTILPIVLQRFIKNKSRRLSEDRTHQAQLPQFNNDLIKRFMAIGYTYSNDILLISSSLNGSYFGSSTFKWPETFEYNLNFQSSEARFPQPNDLGDWASPIRMSETNFSKSISPMEQSSEARFPQLNQMLEDNSRQVRFHGLQLSETQSSQSGEERFAQQLQLEQSNLNERQLPQYSAAEILNKLPNLEKNIEFPLSMAYFKNENLKKLSYYNAGRAFFDQFSREALINLWPKFKNIRKFSSGSLLTQDSAMNFLHFSRCYEFENYIISLLSGKGAELFILSTQSEKLREAHASSSYLMDFEKTNPIERSEIPADKHDSPKAASFNCAKHNSPNCNNFSYLNKRRQDTFLIQSYKLIDIPTSYMNLTDRESAHYPNVQSTINRAKLDSPKQVSTKMKSDTPSSFQAVSDCEKISLSFNCCGIEQSSIPQKRNSSNYLKNMRYYLFESFLTCHDTIQATQLLESMIEKWSFYSKKLLTRTSIKLPKNRHYQEIHQENEIEFLFELSNEIEKEFYKEMGFQKVRQNQNYQKLLTRAWWQNKITSHFRDFENRLDWYRVYLPDPDERHWNEEYVPSDSYYQNQQTHYSVTNSNIQSSYLQISLENPNFLTISFHFYGFIEKPIERSDIFQKTHDSMFIQQEKQNNNPIDRSEIPPANRYFDNELIQSPINSSSVEDVDNTLTKSTLLNWNDFSKLDRDFIFQKIILNSVNTSFLRFDTSRDLLDYLADFLLRYEKLRSHEIQKISGSFSKQ